MAEMRRETDRWPPPTKERHAQTIMLLILTAVLGVLGTMILDAINGLRTDVQKIDVKVEKVENRLIDVEKKLVAVATKESILRKTVEEHTHDRGLHTP